LIGDGLSKGGLELGEGHFDGIKRQIEEPGSGRLDCEADLIDSKMADSIGSG
jgi:hypothetical protein